MSRLLASSAADAQRGRAEAEARRSSPEAQAQLRRSKNAYRGLTRANAVAAAQAFFAIGRPLWESPALQPGDELVQYVGDSAMLIDRAGAPGKALVASTLPLWTMDSSGRGAPMSIRLEDHGSTYAPENPLVGSAVSKDHGGGVSLLGRGITLRPVLPADTTEPSTSTTDAQTVTTATDADAPAAADTDASASMTDPEADPAASATSEPLSTTEAGDAETQSASTDAALTNPASTIPASTQPRADEAGTLVGNSVFFSNTETDTDWLVAPTPLGAEIDWQLRSPDSPTDLGLDASLPDGAHLEYLTDGSGVAVQRGDTRLATIGAPVASDAQGRSVPTAMTIDGSRLTVHIAHREGDFAYPILVDPSLYVMDALTDFPGLDPNDPADMYQGWHWGSDFLSGFDWDYIGTTQIQSTFGGTSYPNNAWSTWFYQSPGNAYIYEFAFSGLSALLAPNACNLTGITDHSITQWFAGPNSAGTSTGYAQACAPSSGRADLVAGSNWPGSGWHCAKANCAGGTDIEGDLAHVVLSYPSATVAQGNSATAMDAASVWLSDDHPPYLIDYPERSGWTTDNMVQGDVYADDDGLGVKQVRAQLNGGAAEFFTSGCDGTAWNPCSDAPVGGTISWGLPEGANDIAYSADDILEPTSHDDATHDVVEHVDWLVDRSSPKVSFTGPLWTRHDRIVGSAMSLTTVATDGTSGGDPSLERSGVKQIIVEMREAGSTGPWTTVKDSGVQACPNWSCKLTADWTFDPSAANLTPGTTYAIQAKAQDQLGQWSPPVSFNVVAGAGSITSIKDGQKTSRRIKLAAQRLAGAAGLTSVQFEYRRTSSDSWQPIPVAQLTQDRDQAVGGWPLSLDSNGKSPTLTWDVAATPGIDFTDGDVQVRGVLSGSAGSNETQDVLFKLDQRGLDQDHALADVGPGKVDLLTGNFAVSDTDVSIESPLDDLTLTRTFNSRDANANPTGPLGPGWVLGLPAAQGNVDFVSLRNYAEASSDGIAKNYATVTRADGSEVVFSQVAKDATTVVFEPQNAATDLELVATPSASDPSKTDKFTLTDAAGDTTIFVPTPTTGTYELQSVTQPGTSSVKSTYTFEPDGNTPAGRRPTRILAPPPAGVTCTTMVAGCRALDLVYAATDTQVAGEYPGRLMAVKLNAPPAAAVEVARYSYDADGRLAAAWDPRIAPNLKGTYAYDSGGRLSQVTPPGELPWKLQYLSPSSGDTGAGRLHAITRATVSGGSVGADAQWTVVYGIPHSGNSAPYDLSEAATSAWAQNDLPTDATAIFPPDQVPDDPLSSYSRAEISYLDAAGREVNHAEPGAYITTTEYDQYGNLIRELTAANRARALASGDPAGQAVLLDTQRTYSADGVDLVDELGPLHTVTAGQSARKHTTITYDEAKPTSSANVNYHLPTTTTVASRVGSTDSDTRTTKTGYAALDAGGVSGWDVRQPTSVAVDPSGLNLVTRTRYNAQGQVTRDSRPKDSGASTAATTISTHWNASGAPAACQGHSEWTGMLCQAAPAADPSASGRSDPSLPKTTYTYNSLDEVVTESNAVSSGPTRTTTTSYDAAGRKTSEAVAATGSGAGTTLPDVSYGYADATGRLLTTTAGGQSITRAYDQLGRLTSYTDADGTTSTTTYDALDRAVAVGDGKGSQTNTYDDRGLITQVVDNQFGTITGDYDADGQLTRETLPGGLDLLVSYDETGAQAHRCYTRTSGCSSSAWIDMAGTKNVHGQWITENTTGLGARTYGYDKAARLTRVEDTPAGQSCILRTYGYDANSNRTQAASWSPQATCPTGTTGGTSTTPQYDQADRLIDSGVTYDSLGRTLQLPSADAGGSALTDTYYIDDRVRSMAQGAATTTFLLDPLRRTRVRQRSSGGDETVHYSDDTDSSSYTETTSSSERQISGLDGDLIGTYSSPGGGKLLLSDLHGDAIAEADTGSSTSGPSTTFDNDEFGVPSGPSAKQGYGTTILNTAGLLSHWRLGEPSGNAADAGPTNVALTPSGTITRSVTGALASDSNTADTFAAGAGFSASDRDSYDIRTGSKSWEFWVKTDRTNSSDVLDKSGTNGSNGIQIWLSKLATDGRLTVRLNGTDYLTSAKVLNDNVWHYVAVTVNRAAGTLTIYIDGAIDASASVAALAGVNLDNTGSLTVSGTTTATAAITLDELALYDRSLSLDDVQQHYTIGKAGQIGPAISYSIGVNDTAGLLSAWRLGEASGNAIDSGPTGAALTASGSITRNVTGALSGDGNAAMTFAAGAGFSTPDRDAYDIKTGSKSWEFWVKTERTNSTDVVDKSGTNGANGIQIWLSKNAGDGKLTVRLNGTDYFTSSKVLNDNVWHHVAVVLNRGSNALTLYIDGTSEASTSVASLAGVNLDNSGALLVSGPTTAQYPITLDEVALYDGALSASDVLQRYSLGKNGPATVQGPLRRFQWVGSKQRTTEFSTGIITMGQRVYVPQFGRFLQVDPVPGGSCNPYDYACQDPVNSFDLDGRENSNVGGSPNAGGLAPAINYVGSKPYRAVVRTIATRIAIHRFTIRVAARHFARVLLRKLLRRAGRVILDPNVQRSLSKHVVESPELKGHIITEALKQGFKHIFHL